jgi:hypothetical protein
MTFRYTSGRTLCVICQPGRFDHYGETAPARRSYGGCGRERRPATYAYYGLVRQKIHGMALASVQTDVALRRFTSTEVMHGITDPNATG